MTTNSPNPFDGDVQALIDAAREDINFLEGVREKRGHLFELEEQKLALIKIALAALMAKPYAYEFVTSGKKQVILNRVLPPVDMDEIIPLYTTSTAHILRPVELPGFKKCPQEYVGSQFWIEINAWNKAVSACAESLRQQGYDVKS